MELVRMLTDDGPRLARADGDELNELTSRDPMEALAHPDPAETGRVFDRRSVSLLTPVIPGKIIAIGLNYRDHAEETGQSIPERPLIFAKFPSSVIGPFDDIVKLDETNQLDYEGELAVVIRRRCRRVDRSQALEAIAGYTVANDVSARDAQFADVQWVRGKSFDTFCPLGPGIRTLDEIDDPFALSVSTRVNGELRQHSNTSNLIFQVDELVSYCSRYFTLEPGDVILSGTPSGIGFSREPPCFLEPADVVEIEIAQVGTIRNKVVAQGDL